MTDQVTSHDSWTKKKTDKIPMSCWNCEVGSYVVYPTDLSQTPRCGRCGELEQDDPAKSKPAASRRGTAKAKEKA